MSYYVCKVPRIFPEYYYAPSSPIEYLEREMMLLFINAFAFWYLTEVFRQRGVFGHYIGVSCVCNRPFI